MSEILIRPFKPADAPAFDALNRRWIEKYFALEPKDLEQIEHPQRTIIETGGKILIAEEDGASVGCVALINQGEQIFELAKMAVDPGKQGKGVGRLLLDAAIDWARKQSASRLWLETNDVLEAALGLYRKAGFHDADWDYVSPYSRCNTVMEFPL